MKGEGRAVWILGALSRHSSSYGSSFSSQESRGLLNQPLTSDVGPFLYERSERWTLVVWKGLEDKDREEEERPLAPFVTFVPLCGQSLPLIHLHICLSSYYNSHIWKGRATNHSRLMVKCEYGRVKDPSFGSKNHSPPSISSSLLVNESLMQNMNLNI